MPSETLFSKNRRTGSKYRSMSSPPASRSPACQAASSSASLATARRVAADHFGGGGVLSSGGLGRGPGVPLGRRNVPAELDTLLEGLDAPAGPSDSIEGERLHRVVRARLLDET